MSRQPRPSRSVLRAAGVMALAAALLPAMAYAAEDDPRKGLAPGYLPWSEASSNIDLLDNDPRVAPFDAPPGNFGFVNSDLAFTGDTAVVGNFNGFQFYDISDPTDPTLSGSFVCPGGQGDVSIHGNLLFMSVEQNRARLDCGTSDAEGDVNAERFRGIRIFDITDLNAPRQIAAIQTCRGSHTHTQVPDPRDRNVLYIYNSGTADVRPTAELSSCSGGEPGTNAETALYSIDVIKVPLDNPEAAAIVNRPRIFADRDTGAIAGRSAAARTITPAARSTDLFGRG